MNTEEMNTNHGNLTPPPQSESDEKVLKALGVSSGDSKGDNMEKSTKINPVSTEAADTGASGNVTTLKKKKEEKDADGGDMVKPSEKDTAGQASKKSMDADPADKPTEEDLEKALSNLEEVAASVNVTVDRRAELGELLAKGEITDDQREELLDLLKSDVDVDTDADDSDDGSDDNDDTDMSKAYTNALLDDPDIQAGHKQGDIDVSAWIANHVTVVGNALDRINNDISKALEGGFGQQYRFNNALSKAIKAQSTIIEHLSDRLEKIENTPMPRQGFTSAQAIEKAFGPGATAENIPPREVVLEGLRNLTKSYVDGKIQLSYDPAYATTFFESHNEIRPDILNDALKAAGHK